jgi:hypothetical protein
VLWLVKSVEEKRLGSQSRESANTLWPSKEKATSDEDPRLQDYRLPYFVQANSVGITSVAE